MSAATVKVMNTFMYVAFGIFCIFRKKPKFYTCSCGYDLIRLHETHCSKCKKELKWKRKKLKK